MVSLNGKSLTFHTPLGMIRSLFSRMSQFSAKKHPASSGHGDVTMLLRRLADGESSVRSQLIELVYPELRRIAEMRMRTERNDHTLQPTALVSEFFLEMARQEGISWNDRKHFLAAASQAMRRFLIDHARHHNSIRHGGGELKLSLDDFDLGDGGAIDVLVIDDLLEQLAIEEPRMARVVELRCFGGLTHAEIADILGVDERTAKRDWRVARAWLYGKLAK